MDFKLAVDEIRTKVTDYKHLGHQSTMDKALVVSNIKATQQRLETIAEKRKSWQLQLVELEMKMETLQLKLQSFRQKLA